MMGGVTKANARRLVYAKALNAENALHKRDKTRTWWCERCGKPFATGNKPRKLNCLPCGLEASSRAVTGMMSYGSPTRRKWAEAVERAARKDQECPCEPCQRRARNMILGARAAAGFPWPQRSTPTVDEGPGVAVADPV